MFRPHKTLKKTRIELYNTLDLPGLIYSTETWNINARDARRITAAEMKYMRKTAGYSFTDYKTNTDFAKVLNITPDAKNGMPQRAKLETIKLDEVKGRLPPFLGFLPK
jgi:hypothetical protein